MYWSKDKASCCFLNILHIDISVKLSKYFVNASILSHKWLTPHCSNDLDIVLLLSNVSLSSSINSQTTSIKSSIETRHLSPTFYLFIIYLSAMESLHFRRIDALDGSLCVTSSGW